MAVHRKLWAIVSILLLLVLAACGPGFDAAQGHQAQLTTSPASMTPSTSKTATPTAALQITLAARPTAPPTKPTQSPGNGNNGGSSSPTPQEQQLAQYVLGLINHDRAAMGLPAYSWSSALAGGAHLHNLSMMAYGQLSHQCPSEPGLGTRITNDGITWRAAGENIEWSDYPDPQQGVQMNHQSMMAEQPPNDGHRQNILSTSFNLVGIDVLIDAHHNTWLTEDFAQA